MKKMEIEQSDYEIYKISNKKEKKIPLKLFTFFTLFIILISSGFFMHKQGITANVIFGNAVTTCNLESGGRDIKCNSFFENDVQYLEIKNTYSNTMFSLILEEVKIGSCTFSFDDKIPYGYKKKININNCKTGIKNNLEIRYSTEQSLSYTAKGYVT